MITQEEFDRAIKNKINQIENEVDNSLINEVTDGIFIQQTAQLILHLKNKEITKDIDLYNQLKSNSIAQTAKKITDNEELKNEIMKISSDTIKRLEGLDNPAISDKVREELLKNEKRKKIIQTAREKLIKLIDSKTKNIVPRRDKLIKQKQEAFMKRVNWSLRQAHKLTIEGEKIEKELIDVLNELKVKINARNSLEKQMVEFAKPIDEQQASLLHEKIKESLEIESDIDEHTERKEELEKKLFEIKDKIIGILEKEVSIVPSNVVSLEEYKKKREREGLRTLKELRKAA